MKTNETKGLKLSYGCVFSDFNNSKGLQTNHVTTELQLGALKYGHIRQMEKLKPQDHMAFAMSAISGLSEKDLNELSANDAAELMKIVYDNLRAHLDLAKNFMTTDYGQNYIANALKSQHAE